MSDLTAFLLARIVEDESEAINVRHRVVNDEFPRGAYEFRAMRAGIECEAKRRIVREYMAHVNHYESREADGLPADAVRRDARVARRAVEVLAAIYADHPDYREEWRA